MGNTGCCHQKLGDSDDVIEARGTLGGSRRVVGASGVPDKIIVGEDQKEIINKNKYKIEENSISENTKKLKQVPQDFSKEIEKVRDPCFFEKIEAFNELGVKFGLFEGRWILYWNQRNC